MKAKIKAYNKAAHCDAQPLVSLAVMGAHGLKRYNAKEAMI